MLSKNNDNTKLVRNKVDAEKGVRAEEGGPTPAASSGGKRGSEYKRQLVEKQRLKSKIYKMRERQFRRFFELASRDKTGGTGDNLLSYLERRLDNVVFRLKLATSRRHARQMVVHGHFMVNGKYVKSPSFLVKTNDVISLAEKSKTSETLKSAFEKRFNSSVKVPEWLNFDADNLRGVVLRLPMRTDIPTKIETSLIVELYSK